MLPAPAVALEYRVCYSRGKASEGQHWSPCGVTHLLQVRGSVWAVTLGHPSLTFLTVLFISSLNIPSVTKCIFDDGPKFTSALVFNLHELAELITCAPGSKHVGQLLSSLLGDWLAATGQPSKEGAALNDKEPAGFTLAPCTTFWKLGGAEWVLSPPAALSIGWWRE